MKLVNYEKKGVFIFLIVFLFVLLLIFCIYTWCFKINSYSLFVGRVRKKNLVELYVENSKMNIIYKNSNVYIDDMKKKFSIVSVDKDILVDGEVKYSLVVLETNISLIDGEVLELVFKDKRIGLFRIFNVIWEGGHDEEN